MEKTPAFSNRAEVTDQTKQSKNATHVSPAEPNTSVPRQQKYNNENNGAKSLEFNNLVNAKNNLVNAKNNLGSNFWGVF